MAKVAKYSNYRIEVYVEEPYFISENDPKYLKRMRDKCEEVIAQIKRHCDGVTQTIFQVD